MCFSFWGPIEAVVQKISQRKSSLKRKNDWEVAKARMLLDQTMHPHYDCDAASVVAPDHVLPVVVVEPLLSPAVSTPAASPQYLALRGMRSIQSILLLLKLLQFP